MKKIFQLFTAIVIFGIFVGCGGDGGGSSGSNSGKQNEDELSLDSIEAYFSTLDDLNASVVYRYSKKEYYPVLTSEVNDFINRALSGWGFDGIDKYINTIDDLEAEVRAYPDDIRLSLEGNKSIIHEDALYTSIYGDIDAKVNFVSIRKDFNGGDLVTIFNVHFWTLCSSKLTLATCDSNNATYWYGYKTIGNLTYILDMGVNINNGWATWTITK